MDAKGQSILEVVFLLPFLFLFVALLFKLNMAVQMAINNTQYARTQLFMLTNNSPEYPRLSFRSDGGRMTKTQSDLMVLTVADPSAIEGSSGNELDPIPQIQSIGGVGTKPGSEAGGETGLRTNIRVRDSAAICTQMNWFLAGKALDSHNVRAYASKRWPFGKIACSYHGKWIGD
jgi:hypothetical protein